MRAGVLYSSTGATNYFVSTKYTYISSFLFLCVSCPTLMTHHERTIVYRVPRDLGRQNGNYSLLKSLPGISW